MPKKSSPFPMEDAPNYNPEDPFADKVALTDHRHYMLGQHFIKEGRVRVLRKKLEECYGTHGVNHFEECTEIRKKYIQATKEVNLNWLDANAWRSDYDPESPAF